MTINIEVSWVSHNATSYTAMGYVSAILYRSVVFEGAPVQPLLMLVHERRTTESHELIMKWLGKLCGITSPTFVVDREQAITTAIRSVFPAATVVYCWNHILADVRVSETCAIGCVK